MNKIPSLYTIRRSLIKRVFSSVALLIFILLIIWPYFRTDPESSLNFQKPSVGNAIKMMKGASFYGLTSKGEAYTVNAQKIAQITLKDFFLSNISIVLNTDNKHIQMVAQEGVASTTDKGIHLSKGLNVTLQDGSTLYTNSALLNLEQGTAKGQEKVEGVGPLGKLEAGGFEIEEKGKTLRFINRVKVCLTPSLPSKKVNQ